jgi:hypothetical protein
VKVDSETDPLGTPATSTIPAPKTTVAKRGSPEYRQFSAYLRADLYRQLKIRVAEREIDLSDAINEAVQHWLAKATDQAIADSADRLSSL